MTALTFAAVFLSLLALGAHVVVPLRAAGQPSTEIRNAWGLTALPLLLVACVVALWRLSSHVELLLEAGWGTPGLLTVMARSLAVLLPALLLVDLVLMLGRRKMEPVGFRLAGLFALLPLATVLTTEGILARGEGAVLSLGLILAVLCRVLVALGTAEALAPTPRSNRPFWTIPAALALVGWLGVVPRELFAGLLESGRVVPLGAAAVLFLAARWIPARLRRPTILAAALLACLAFAWVGMPEPEPEVMELDPLTLPAP